MNPIDHLTTDTDIQYLIRDCFSIIYDLLDERLPSQTQQPTVDSQKHEGDAKECEHNIVRRLPDEVCEVCAPEGKVNTPNMDCDHLRISDEGSEHVGKCLDCDKPLCLHCHQSFE